MMGRQPRPAFEAMIAWHQLSDTWEQLKAESEKVFLALLDDHLAAMPGLLELLADLERAGVPKAIGTSSARRLVDACLARLNLQGRFAFILAAEDVVHSKPDPEIYLTAARRFHVPAGEMAVLEDSTTGCRAAAAAGRTRWPFPATIAGSRISALPSWSPTRWPTRGCMKCWGLGIRD